MQSSEHFLGDGVETPESSLPESESLQTQPKPKWKFISIKEVPKPQINFIGNLRHATQIKTRYVSPGGDNDD